MIPQYPKDFFDFGKGVPVTDEEINEWIQEAVTELKERDDLRSVAKATGDTRVEVRKVHEEGADGHYIEILVCRGYQRAYTWG
ncbi:hypothetical protein M655_025090 [Brevibacillus sp. NSP2.1]|uniref:hypothetical protein n=1 Tax=Brevibacillus sp. NSP2.1 TaxID=3003229 RepID=UPI0004032DEE|nr:hypothetical protein [Brevibacillus sp. NSP2.1]QHZ58646.1 hypothetical protein M655_025090 [Brevibacillus sp. NSP2.1]